MKIKLFRILLILITITMNSCSSDTTEDTAVDYSSQKNASYTYTPFELETINLINEYRVSIGLNPLEKVNLISIKSEEHNNYMIAKNTLSHDGFVERSENIMKILGAINVGENVASCPYSGNPKAVVKAWLASPEHKKNIEGNFTHFGISMREDPATGKKYYTNIFARI